MKRVEVADTLEEALVGLQATVGRLLQDTSKLRVLDAGCGGRMLVDIRPDAYIVGIDISAAQLQRNATVDERILGDIQSFPLPAASFDLVVCWDVLEHLRRPRVALENLSQALRPGGLLVLGGPNVLSLKGLATWITPYWLHQMIYWGSHRGSRSVRPFKTYRRPAAVPTRIVSWAKSRRMETEYLAAYESPMQSALRRRVHLTGRAWLAVRAVARTLSFGFVDLMSTDYVLLLRR